MDVLQSSRKLINDIISVTGAQMKILLMDGETTPSVSCAYAQSEIMQKEVYIFDRIDYKTPKENISHLKCVVFVRPTSKNIEHLVQELKHPRFNQYYIYFSNAISKYDIKSLAEADENEVVREVQEVYMDGIPLRKDLLTVNLPHIYGKDRNVTPEAFERMKCSIVALLLQLRKNPSVRYQGNSQNAQKLADEVNQFIKRENGLFEHSKSDSTILIVERSFDVVTPLLNQWTYEAMVHELLTLTNNRFSCGGQNFVLSELNDEFFAENIISNFGEIGQNIKSLVNTFQEKKHINKNLESISDMKKFVEDYPQFKKMTGTVSKHVSLVEELSKIVQDTNLLEISELEQSIVADGDAARCFQRIKELLANPRTTELNAMRLVMLYRLRFENNANYEYNQLINHLGKRQDTSVIEKLLRYSEASRRSADLFGEATTMEITKKFIKGLKGVENIYTQHEPYLKKVIENLVRGKLDNFPSIGTDNQRRENIIVFVIGGATYEEAACVRTFNQRRAQGYGGPAVILASNCMLNTKSFTEQLRKL